MLKKMVVRLFRIGIVSLFAFYLGLFLYYRFAWKLHYFEDDVLALTASINSAPAFPESFYNYYDKVYGDRHETVTKQYLIGFWKELLLMKPSAVYNWQYQVANTLKYKGHRYKLAPVTLAFKISQYATPEKCFDYLMADRYEKYCKEFKLNDAIENLNDAEQIARFIIANERPRYYRFHPGRFRAEVDSLSNVRSDNN